MLAAGAGVERNQAELGDAQLNFQRLSTLYQREVSPKADYDVAEARLLKARVACLDIVNALRVE